MPYRSKRPTFLRSPVATSDAKTNYFVRHWRGDLPLAQAYWINVVVTNGVVRLGLFLFATYFANSVPSSVLLSAILGFWPCLLFLVLWQIVGVARSANRYASQSTASANPVLARIALFVLACTFALGFVRSGIPQIADAIRIVRGDPQWPDPVLSILPNGRELEFSGNVKFGSADKMERLLLEHPGIKVLQLDTGGGRDREALAMAAVVRKHKLNTYVGVHCSSAGVIVFLAGQERIVRNDAKLGFHAWRAPGTNQRLSDDRQVQVLTTAGANKSFIEQAINTPSESMWYPELQELVDQGLATRISDGSGFSLGSREIAHYTIPALRDELETNPVMNALAKRDPVGFGKATEHAARLIAQGADIKTSLKDVNELLAAATRDAYPLASNAALDACLELNLEILRRNMYQAPDKTLQVLSQQVPKRTVPDYPAQTETRYLAALLESPPLPAFQEDDSQALHEEAELIRKFMKGENAQTVLRDFPVERARQVFYCEAANNIFTAIKHMTPEHRYPLIRLCFGLGPPPKIPPVKRIGVR